MTDQREPKPCHRCGEMCKHDGWGHVHANGIGIGSCPPPRLPRLPEHLQINDLNDYLRQKGER